MAVGKEVGVLGIKKHGSMGANKMKGNEYGAQTAVGKITGGVELNKSKQKSMQTKFNAKAKTDVGLSMGGHTYGTHHSGHSGGGSKGTTGQGWKGGR